MHSNEYNRPTEVPFYHRNIRRSLVLSLIEVMVQYVGIGLYIITMLLPLYLKDMKATATLLKMRSQHKQIFTNTKTGYALYTVIQ